MSFMDFTDNTHANQHLWLKKLSKAAMKRMQVPRKKILHESLYYPASSLDNTPIVKLKGKCHSFVYADYQLSKSEARRILTGPWLRGYRLFWIRDVSAELGATGWWSAPYPNDQNQAAHLRSIMKEKRENLHPFALWVIYETVNRPVHEYNRISLLYLCQDAIAAFQRLYWNQTHPKFLAIIQPGHDLGGNYTDFTNDKQILGRLVLQSSAERPDYLLYGYNSGKGKRWGEYSQDLGIEDFNPHRPYPLELWARRGLQIYERRVTNDGIRANVFAALNR